MTGMSRSVSAARTAPQRGREAHVARDLVLLNTGVRLLYRRQGPETGPAVIMLHGYSDSKDIGHTPHWEVPDVVVAKLLGFIQGS